MLQPASSAPPARRAPRRARPLPPDARRASLIAAILPLVRRYGVNVSTRQIARAAGVAEGTIFRAFPDKESLIRAAVDAALDAAPAVAAIGQIDPALPLAERLIAAARIVQARLTAIIDLRMALQACHPGGKAWRRHEPHADPISAAVARLIEPDRARLRAPPAEVARLLRLLLFSGSHRAIAGDELLTPEEAVGTILDGVRLRATSRSGRSRSC
ncbi:MAG: TetR/AcrR family transcriptional regulator [Steroidobacteraceae bacterium]